jgi:hypothetical protein
MIGIRQEPEGGARAKSLNEPIEQLSVSELVAFSLQEQHRQLDR